MSDCAIALHTISRSTDNITKVNPSATNNRHGNISTTILNKSLYGKVTFMARELMEATIQESTLGTLKALSTLN